MLLLGLPLPVAPTVLRALPLEAMLLLPLALARALELGSLEGEGEALGELLGLLLPLLQALAEALGDTLRLRRPEALAVLSTLLLMLPLPLTLGLALPLGEPEGE